jgi:hypothetical protein
MPVVAGETFAIKVGVTGTPALKVEVSDAAGKVVASGRLGSEPFGGTAVLYWTTLDIPSPVKPGLADFTVRAGQALSRFTVAATPKPEHTLRIAITDSKMPLGGVEVRLGPFHARSDSSGRAQVRICKGEYQLQLWRSAHIAPPRPIRIEGDTAIALTMRHVPEEHPDARWVR